MTIEILYPELGRLFGDSGNVLYLQKCLPSADFVMTHVDDEPWFVHNTPDLIYMGPATEKNQVSIIGKLLPYRDRLKELMDNQTVMLFTGNAGEVFFHEIRNWDGAVTPALDLFPLTVVRSHYDRYNGLCLGSFCSQFDVVGFRSQFDFWEGDNTAYPFLEVKRGIGINKSSMKEGLLYNRTMITGLLGPILINNPDLVRWLLDQIGAQDQPVLFEKELREAFARRLSEFNNPSVKFAI